MWLFSLLLFAFVSQNNGGGISSSLEYKMYQRSFNYYDKYIYSPYLETEKQTCELSIKVIQNLQNTSLADIWSPLRNISNEMDKFKTILDGRDKEGCVEEIKNIWNDFVVQENSGFKQRLQSALIEQEKQQVFVSEAFNNYTLAMMNLRESLTECHEHSSLNMTSCISEARHRWGVQTWALHNTLVIDEVQKQTQVFSPCMTAFESSVLRYLTERTERISEEIGRIRADLYMCSNQSETSNLVKAIQAIEVPAPFNASYAMYVAKDVCGGMYNYSWATLTSFVELDVKAHFTLAKVFLDSKHWQELRTPFQEYADTVEKSRIDYPDIPYSKCNVKIEMNEPIADGIQEIKTCERTYGEMIQQILSEGEEKFKNMTGEFGQVGNLAILNCINDPYAFRTNKIIDCYDFIYISNGVIVGKVENEFKDVVKKLNIYFPKEQGLPSSIRLCVKSQYQRIGVIVSQALYDYNKCLYLETGIDYNIKLSSNTTDTFPITPLEPVIEPLKP